VFKIGLRTSKRYARVTITPAANSGNVRFLFWKRVGGAVTLAEAIRKLKCST